VPTWLLVHNAFDRVRRASAAEAATWEPR
jgi:hypothetical protein